MKQLVILGSGGYAQEVLWVVDDLNERKPEFDFLGFVDPGNPGKKGQEHYGRPILGGFEVASEFQGEIYFACGIGDPASRMKEAAAAEEFGWKPATLIHPTVVVARYCTIGEGTVIGAGSVVAPNAKLGRYCAVNNHVGVGHDTELGDYVVLSPGCRILGGAVLADRAFIGANATVYLKKRVGEGAVLGANSFLLNDLKSGRSAIGNPAVPFGGAPGGGICSVREQKGY